MIEAKNDMIRIEGDTDTILRELRNAITGVSYGLKKVFSDEVTKEIIMKTVIIGLGENEKNIKEGDIGAYRS